MTTNPIAVTLTCWSCEYDLTADNALLADGCGCQHCYEFNARDLSLEEHELDKAREIDAESPGTLSDRDLEQAAYEACLEDREYEDYH